METKKIAGSGGDVSSLVKYDGLAVELRNEGCDRGSPQPPLESLVHVSQAVALGVVIVVVDQGKDEGLQQQGIGDAVKGVEMPAANDVYSVAVLVDAAAVKCERFSSQIAELLRLGTTSLCREAGGVGRE